LGKGIGVRGPSKAAEAIVAFFLPASRRDEVLGDLYERYRSPGQYALDAICTVPCVIFSEFLRSEREAMDLKTVVAIAGAFVLGLLFGIVQWPAKAGWQSVLHNSIPFLLLFTLWIILLAVKFTRRKPKC